MVPGLAGANTAQAWLYSRPGDPNVGTFLANPVIVEYRDPDMGHTTYIQAPLGDKYITAATIWDFFFTHPRP